MCGRFSLPCALVDSPFVNHPTTVALVDNQPRDVRIVLDEIVHACLIAEAMEQSITIFADYVKRVRRLHCFPFACLLALANLIIGISSDTSIPRLGDFEVLKKRTYVRL